MSKEQEKILNDFIFDHSYEIIDRLINEDKALRKMIEDIAQEFIKDVDEKEVAENLFHDLDSIPIENILDNSVRSRDGYVNPYDLAWQMFEDAVESYLKKARMYRGPSINPNMDRYYMGLLKGVHKFKKESKSEYKHLVMNAPAENFEIIKEDWIKNCKNPKKVDELVKKTFSNW